MASRPRATTPRQPAPSPRRGGRYEIEIADRQEVLGIDPRFLKRAAAQVLTAERVRKAELSVVVVDDREMQELNRRYLEHDWPTDVISFLLECETGDERRVKRGEPLGSGKVISGEVIVSTQTAKRNSTIYRWTPLDELLLYLVHGILHLCGYDDLSPAALRTMRAREAEVLGAWNLKPRYSRVGAHAAATKKLPAVRREPKSNR